MGKSKRYAFPIKEVREVVVGWRLACVVCDEQFEAKRRDALYCSDQCRQQAFRDRSKRTRFGALHSGR